MIQAFYSQTAYREAKAGSVGQEMDIICGECEGLKYRRGKNRHVGSSNYSHVISFEGEDEPDECQGKPGKSPEI
jgi:hypothetical protein